MHPKTNKMNVRSEADEESMMAETLLKIRSDSLNEAASSPQNPRSQPTLLVSPPRPVKTTTTLSSPANVPFSPSLTISSMGSPSGSPSPDISASATTINPNLRFYSRSQIFGDVSDQALKIQQAIQQAAGVASLSAASNSISFLQLLSKTRSNEFHGTSLQAASHVTASPVNTPSMLVPRGSEGSQPDGSVRKDEVEKALFSQPQRGRKRDNLTDVERLELTRTRNREHAKSTRIRKKARHQELIESEKKLKEFLKMEDLNKKRRDCVIDFLAVREGMLQSVSRCDSSVKGDATMRTNNVGSSTKKLEDIVEDLSTFIFEVDSTDGAGTTAVARMTQFDEDLVSRVAHKLNEYPSPYSLSYMLKGTSDDIALSLSGSAMLEVKLVLERPVNRRVLSALMRLDFVPDSDKLRSCRFTALKDSFGNGLFDQLREGQVSHPSVVSLEVEKDRREADNNNTSREGDKNGPGMNI